MNRARYARAISDGQLQVGYVPQCKWQLQTSSTDLSIEQVHVFPSQNRA